MEDEIVISGISGKFSESENMWEFRDHLFNQDDMTSVDDRRWKPGSHHLPERFGKVKVINKFDDRFFGIGPKQVEAMDFQIKMFLEAACEAIYDSGNSLASVRGTKTGVYLSGTTESLCSGKSSEGHDKTYILFNLAVCLTANRISHFLDLKGPSLEVESACSSGLQGLYEAFSAIRCGDCDAALVLATNVTCIPNLIKSYNNLKLLSPDGYSKSFDKSANGYGRGEALVAVFLQRTSAAKRIYATVVNAGTGHDGYREQGIMYPSGTMQKELMLRTYRRVNVNPKDVTYIEAHGTGTTIGDTEEVNAITEVFCDDRDQPLLIGSVKSNMGHSEIAAGLCSVAKVLIAMEEELIPANLHFENPNPNIPGLMDGRLKVVTENTPWKDGLVAVSCFGVGGSSAHAILRSNPKKKSPEKTEDLRLFAISGRTEKAVDDVLTFMENNTDSHLYALWSDIMNKPPRKNNFRGFCIQNSTASLKTIQEIPKIDRQIWFIYPGVGAQWGGMGRDLLKIPYCRKVIEDSSKLFEDLNMDLIEIIENSTEEDYTNDALKSTITSVAIQIALTKTLKFLGINPDGFIGHSVGELLCAYADDCITAAELVKVVTLRTQYIINTKSEDGAMAAVGKSWEECKAICSEGLYLACNNSPNSVTVSGREAKIDEFIADMKKQKVLVRKVNSCGFAFHTPYMESHTKSFQEFLKIHNSSVFLDQDRIRSSRWVSTTFPEEEWDTPMAKSFTWDYLWENVVRPVRFYEALQFIPENSIVIEIGPHNLLLNLLKSVFGSRCICFGLQNKKQTNNVEFFLTNLGKFYLYGAELKISNLYNLPSFPVPKGTSMISPLIGWDHRKDHSLHSYSTDIENSISIEVNIQEGSKDHFLIGHVIDGRILYPATGYLMLVWEAFARIKEKSIDEMPVIIEDVNIVRATILSSKVKTKFFINIVQGSGEFEISERNSTVMTGRILADDPSKETPSPHFDVIPHDIKLQGSDVYKELRLRGYQYGPTFQGIEEADLNGVEGKLNWNGNWIVFLDNMLQFSIISRETRELYIPIRFQQVKINPIKHKQIFEQLNEEGIPLKLHQHLNFCAAGGVEMRGLKAMMMRRNINVQPILYDSYFIPHAEKRCFAAHPEIEQRLQKYYELCSQKMEQIVDKFKFCGNLQNKLNNLISMIENGHLEIDMNNQLNQEFQETNVNTSLLQTLDAILNLPIDELFLQKTQELVNSLYSNREHDSLLTVYVHDLILKPYLQTVLENTTTFKPIIVEINSDTINFGYKAISSLNFPVVKPIYYLAVSENNPEKEDESGSSKVKISTWDVTSSQFNSKAHLIIANQVFSKHSQNYKVYLQNIYDSLSNGGFALIVEPKENNFICNFLRAILGHLEGQLLDMPKLKEAFNEIGFKCIGSKSDGFFYDVFLLRKVKNRQPTKFLNIDDESFEWIEKLKENIKALNPEDIVWLLSTGNPTSGILGLVNSLKYEAGGGQQIRCLFNMSKKPSKFQTTINSSKLITKHDTKSVKPKVNLVKTISNDVSKNMNKDSNNSVEEAQQNKLLEAIVEADLVLNIIKDSQWCSFSFVPPIKGNKVIDTEHAYVNCLRSGDFSSLKWVESPLKYQNHKDVYHIYYSALNFRDIMLASGRLPPDALPEHCKSDDCLLGLEFSGRASTGQRVMGIAVDSKAFATTTPANRSIVWPVPEEWTLEEAATIPVVYSTVYYALILRGKLKSHESVLIHSGSGGIGQAAISVALNLGCTVYTTVGSQIKRDLLMKKFPRLTEKNFASSRDTSFEFHILNETEGKGVDVVLNSLAGDKLQASVRCLAYNGRFLEIGKYDLAVNNRLGMSVFLKNISFHGIVLDCNPESPTQKELHQLMMQGIMSGVVQPLNTTIFQKYQWEEAFRYMASGEHTGKILVKIRDEEPNEQNICSPIKVKALAQVYCDPTKCYIITGGLGGFGFELANWLISRGGQHIVLNARSGLKDSYQKLWMQHWKKAGVNVTLNNDDITTKVGALSLIQTSKVIAPIGGIFHLAMVLQDALLENQSPESFFEVYNPKVNGAKNLDNLTRLHCPTMQWFVVFSSIVSAFGNLGQANYSYANSALERICETRHEDGFHGLAIQWGAIDDVGVAYRNWERLSKVTSLVPQPLNSCLTVLEKLLIQEKPVVMCYIVKDQSGQKSEMTLIEKIMNVVGIKNFEQEIDENFPLAELGLDSLMAIEIKTILERDYDCYLNLSDLQALTLAKLKKIEQKAVERQISVDENESENKKTTNRQISEDEEVAAEAKLK